MNRLRLAALLALLCSAPVARAMQTAPPAEEPAAPAGEAIAWPTRAASLVREVEVGPWQLRWVGEQGLGFLPEDRDDARAIADLLDDPDRKVLFEGAGSVVVRMPQGELPKTARVAGKPVAAYQFLSASEREAGAVQLQRTWFALYEPRAGEDGGGEANGLVVLLPGMFGTPEPVIDSTVGALRSRGWHVLRMLTHASRFTERAAYMLTPGGEVEAVARTIADEMGDRAAECALALDAVCGHIAETRPDVPVRHRVGLGMSGGGMILATVIAHDRTDYAAAVFVGAGCDYARISMESNYADWIDAVRVLWLEGARTPEAEERFTAAYRGAAQFDSYRTAPLLSGLPMLMIHGEADEAVPAPMGELLWERLGKPERWSVALGHEALFLAYLPSRTGDLLDWLDRHAAR